MRAVVAVGVPEGARWALEDIAEPPPPGPTEIQVGVKAAALNRADLMDLQRGAHLDAAQGGARVVGRECAGKVIAVGKEVDGYHTGDRVMAMCKSAFAELVTVDQRLVMPVPTQFDWRHAAAAPVGLMTGHNALVTSARLRAGDSVLIHAATSGVGTITVQLANALGLKPIMGTFRTAAKLTLLRKCGLDIGIDTTEEPFEQRVLNATAGHGVDAIIDLVGGPYLNGNLHCLTIGGRLVSVGRLGGSASNIDLEQLAFKRHEIIGVTFRTRSLNQCAAIVRRVIEDVLPLVANSTNSTLAPILHSTFAPGQVDEARRALETNLHIGKLVLEF